MKGCVICSVAAALLCCHHVPAASSACICRYCARGERRGLALRGGGDGAFDHGLRECGVLRHDPLKDNDELFGISFKVRASASLAHICTAACVACLANRCNVDDLVLFDALHGLQACLC